MSRFRLALLLASFSFLTLAGAWWALGNGGIGLDDLALLGRLPAATLLTVALLSIGVYGGDCLRYWACGRVLGVDLTRRTCLDTVVANFFFCWVTPGAAFGTPAAIYVMGRAGVPWGTAVMIGYSKTAIGSGLLMAAVFILLAAGAGPADLGATYSRLLLYGSCTLGGGFLGLISMTLWPAFWLRVVDALYGLLATTRALSRSGGQRFLKWFAAASRTALEGLLVFRGRGLASYVLLICSQLPYFFTFIGVGVVLALGFSAPFWESLSLSTLHLGLLYVSPTPGGSGLAEGSAALFFSDLLGPARAVFLVVACCMATVYLHVVAGLIYLIVRGNMKALLDRSEHGERATDKLPGNGTACTDLLGLTSEQTLDVLVP